MILHSLIYLLLHFVACFLWFAAMQKPLFMWQNRQIGREPLSSRHIAAVYRSGAFSDLVAAAYLTAFPLIVVWVHWIFPTVSCFVPLLVVEIFVSIAIALSAMADSSLYPHWRFKLDKSVFPYLKNLKTAFASVSIVYIIVSMLLLVLLIAVILGSFLLMMNLTGVADEARHPGWWFYPVSILLLAVCVGLLFLVIRGLDSRPNTPVKCFFTTDMFLNHAAVNPLYNLIYSLSVRDKLDEEFTFMDREECDAAVSKMYPVDGLPCEKLLKTDRPNILFIVWESLSSRFVESLGGEPGVTPHLEEAMRQGIVFSNVDAGSFRTDRGLVCLLSGLPGQPTMSVMRDTRRLPFLPALPKLFADRGYKTAVIHGGDLSLLHMADYFICSGHSEIYGETDFDPKAPKCRWGVHDLYMADKVADYFEKNSADKPLFLTFLTLSSHQPYIVPYRRLENKVNNAFAYADEAFGHLMERLKQSGLWDNTLVVVSGDHGLNDPELTPLPLSEYVKIPMLLTGGAVAKPQRIDTLMAQTDLPATLLGQLGMDHSQFIFSRDILAPTYRQPFTIHSYNNGFLLHDDRGYTNYDNAAERAVEGHDEKRELQGRMILQTLYNYISRLGNNDNKG